MTPSMEKYRRTQRRRARNRLIVTLCVSVAFVGYLALGLIASREHGGGDLAVVLVFVFAFMWAGRR